MLLLFQKTRSRKQGLKSPRFLGTKARRKKTAGLPRRFLTLR